MKTAIISDLHLAALPEEGQPLDERREKIAVIYEKSHEFDFIINLGDLLTAINDSGKALAAAESFARFLADADIRTYYVPGNHDTTDVPREILADRLDTPCGAYSFTYEEALFIALDANYTEDGTRFGMGMDWHHRSTLPEAQLDFLEKTLAESACPSAVILCHECLYLSGCEDEGIRLYMTRNAEKARKILEESGKNVLVLQGHYHLADDVVLNGVRYYTLLKFMRRDFANYSVLTAENGEFTLERKTI